LQPFRRVANWYFQAQKLSGLAYVNEEKIVRKDVAIV
jgi:hypothetical protein